MVEKIKDAITKYVIEHCSSSLGVSPDRITSRQIRDYCYFGFSWEEFLSVGLRRKSHVVMELFAAEWCVDQSKSNGMSRVIPALSNPP